MYYTYLLKSEKDGGFYIGYSQNVERRLKEHKDGLVDSTKNRRPIKLVYLEGYDSVEKARAREMKLKEFGSAYQALIKRLGLR
jgi:putative endonuclease